MLRLSFFLRDVFWLTLVVGMGVGWWVDHRGLSALVEREHADAQIHWLNLQDYRYALSLMERAIADAGMQVNKSDEHRYKVQPVGQP